MNDQSAGDHANHASPSNETSLPDGSKPEPTSSATPARLAPGFAGGIAVLCIAAWLTALAVNSSFGELGLILLWAGGFASGATAKKLMGGPSKHVGITLGVGCFLAAVFVETYYLRYSTVQGQEGWLAALKLLPQFVQEYMQSTVIAVIAAGLGALAAYRESAARYEYVRVQVRS